MKIVLVTWLDAHADDDFHSDEQLEALHKPQIAKSVGFLWRRDKTGITLVGCVNEDEDHDRRIFIPAGMVKSVVTLRR